MNKLLIFTMILVLISSCNNVRNDYNKLLSKAIKFPKYPNITSLGRDTIINDYYDSSYKMVIYTDSTECTSCAINKMFLWNPVIDFINKYDEKIKLYFIFSSSNTRVIRLGLRANFFDYPVLIDSLSEFEHLNTHILPKNKAMHTFLLDENNNVIMVGNPSKNKQIEKMFYKEVEKRLGKPQSKKETSKN